MEAYCAVDLQCNSFDGHGLKSVGLRVPPQGAIRLECAGKSFKDLDGKLQNVFEKVDFIVDQGCVYGLLGASGCGKTTLLRCILGRMPLDEGSITVFGHRPGSIESGIPGPIAGYMPQETCIQETLTIAECWTYFGTILGLSKEKINDSVEYFIKLLNLPPANTINGNLSGGELRRVAFAAALIHEPKLLILDEPTVGIDIITKHRMWKHLLHLANEKSTAIILTTHYIEEAREAHKVGLMHGGTLAVEDSTQNLLNRFRCSTLEDVFLKICCNASAVDECEADSTAEVWNPLEKPAKKCWISSNISTDEAIHSVKRCARTNIPLEAFRDLQIRYFILSAVMMKILIHFYRFPGYKKLFLKPCRNESMAQFASSE